MKKHFITESGRVSGMQLPHTLYETAGDQDMAPPLVIGTGKTLFK